MTRTIFIFFLAILVSACGSAGDAPTAALTDPSTPLVLTPTPVIPTPTETPNIPTSTPDALDYQDPTTYPAEVQAYWQTGIWPPYEKQVELSNTFFQPLYTTILQDAGWTQEKINELTPFQLYTSAAKIANEQGYIVPAALDLTRQMAGSLQGVANLNVEGGQYGIIALNINYRDLSDLEGAQNGFNYNLSVFDHQDVTIHHMPSVKVYTQELVLSQLSENKYILVAHYFNTSPVDGKTTEHFLPLSTFFSPTSVNTKINNNHTGLPDTNYSIVSINPVNIEGVLDETNGFSTLEYFENFDTFLQVLRNASGPVSITVDGRLISNEGLEIATGVIIPQKPAATPSPAAPTPTP
jgi:hypothetical protein